MQELYVRVADDQAQCIEALAVKLSDVRDLKAALGSDVRDLKAALGAAIDALAPTRVARALRVKR